VASMKYLYKRGSEIVLYQFQLLAAIPLEFVYISG
jgi:hypothetical protein